MPSVFGGPIEVIGNTPVVNWDLFGKLEKKSFLELNNIHYKKLPDSSITISIDKVENQIKKIEKSSWTKFKVKCNHFDERDIAKLLELDKNIALDSNGSFTKENCLWLENREAVSKFTYLEQPMKPDSENYQVLNADKYANWMADEDYQDVTVIKKLQKHYRSINIKLVKCGGLTPALEMIVVAKELNYKIMIEINFHVSKMKCIRINLILVFKPKDTPGKVYEIGFHICYILLIPEYN